MLVLPIKCNKKNDKVSFEDYKSRLFMLVQFFKYPASLALLPDASLQTGVMREELGSPVLRVRLLVSIGPESSSASFRVLLPVAVQSTYRRKHYLDVIRKLFDIDIPFVSCSDPRFIFAKHSAELEIFSVSRPTTIASSSEVSETICIATFTFQLWHP